MVFGTEFGMRVQVDRLATSTGGYHGKANFRGELRFSSLDLEHHSAMSLANPLVVGRNNVGDFAPIRAPGGNNVIELPGQGLSR